MLLIPRRVLAVFLLLLPFRLAAQTEPDAGAPLAASNLLNPNISLIGNMVAVAGNASDLGDEAFAVREAELALQANVDPYSRADVVVAVTPDGVELEEAYLTFLTLPGGLSAKVGKFRANAGKFNRTHPPETPFADRPLAANAFFGEEGLAGSGASLSWLAPTPFVLNLDAEVTTNFDEAPISGIVDGEGDLVRGGERRDLAYLLRASTYFDLTDDANVTAGVTGLSAPYTPDGDGRTTGGVLDLTFRWKPLDRAIYRSLLWQTELLAFRRSESPLDPESAESKWGLYSYADYQFAQRWHAGVRLDRTELTDVPGHETGALAFLTFAPSEFSRWSLQARTVRLADGSDERAAFLKVTFNIGPHGAHAF